MTDKQKITACRGGYGTAKETGRLCMVFRKNAYSATQPKIKAQLEPKRGDDEWAKKMKMSHNKSKADKKRSEKYRKSSRPISC